MAIVACSRWDDSSWDDEGNAVNLVQSGNTFNVASIDQSNRIVWFTPQNLCADQWDNATFWWDGTLSSHFTVNQAFTCVGVDINNRIAYLSG